MGLQGVLYSNTVDGTSYTESFLNFWGEAYQNRMPNGHPILHYDDIVVLDNCAIRHYEGVYAFSEWLDSIGIDVVYLPVYSPEFNPCELVFNKLKILELPGGLVNCLSGEFNANSMQSEKYSTIFCHVAFTRVNYCRG